MAADITISQFCSWLRERQRQRQTEREGGRQTERGRQRGRQREADIEGDRQTGSGPDEYKGHTHPTRSSPLPS